MAGRDDRWARADWARWFIEHDDVDEAARVLEPGDELELGRSDALDLTAALERRGLSSSHDGRLVRVQPGRGPLAAGPRRPPARALPPAWPAAKRTA